MDFSETWHIDRFWPNLKYEVKNLENICHGSEKPKMVFLSVKTLELQI